MNPPNIYITPSAGKNINSDAMGTNIMGQLDRNPNASSFNEFAPPLFPANYSQEVPPKLLKNNILRVQERGILAHTHSMDELFSIKEILNGENIDANELPINDFGNPPAVIKDSDKYPNGQISTSDFLPTGERKIDNRFTGSIGQHTNSVAQQESINGSEAPMRSDRMKSSSPQQHPHEGQASYGLDVIEDQDGGANSDEEQPFNKMVPKLRFKSPKRKSPSSSEEKLLEVEEPNPDDKPIVHVNKKRRFNSYQYLFSPDFDDNPNKYIDVVRSKYTLPNKSNTYFEDGGKFTEISLAIRKQRAASELAQKDQLKQVRVKKTAKAK